MSARGLATLSLLSLVVPVLETLGAGPLARGSLAALALLPWFLFALVPRSRSADGEGAWRAAAFVALLALPPLALGAGLDLARGAAPGGLLAATGTALFAFVLWRAANEVAARRESARGTYAALWLALVPGAAALRLALVWVPRRGSGEAPGTGLLYALDPLVWCHRWGREGGLAGPVFMPALVVLIGAALVLAATLASARRGEQGSRAIEEGSP